MGRLAVKVVPAPGALSQRSVPPCCSSMICREMSTFTIIPKDVQKLSLEEFSSLVASGMTSTLGGLDKRSAELRR